MECPKCGEIDLSLVSYVQCPDDDERFEVTFECRQCGEQFTRYLNQRQLQSYK
jgi:DNA-directed RNA polymerase subunit M/transcription elongation factor TFIIS